MNENVKKVIEEAALLPAADRLALAEHLLGSLDKADPSIDQLWAAEGERRLADYLEGRVSARDAGDVLGKHLKP